MKTQVFLNKFVNGKVRRKGHVKTGEIKLETWVPELECGKKSCYFSEINIEVMCFV